MMDHRCSARTATDIPALLGLQGRWIPAVIRNISDGGLYVETATDMLNSTYLTVSTAQPPQRAGRRTEFAALVIHRHGRGAGLMVAGDTEELLPDPRPTLRQRIVSLTTGPLRQEPGR